MLKTHTFIPLITHPPIPQTQIMIRALADEQTHPHPPTHSSTHAYTYKYTHSHSHTFTPTPTTRCMFVADGLVQTLPAVHALAHRQAQTHTDILKHTHTHLHTSSCLLPMDLSRRFLKACSRTSGCWTSTKAVAMYAPYVGNCVCVYMCVCMCVCACACECSQAEKYVKKVSALCHSSLSSYALIHICWELLGGECG